jgi:hypothetical protein
MTCIEKDYVFAGSNDQHRTVERSRDTALNITSKPAAAAITLGLEALAVGPALKPIPL